MLGFGALAEVALAEIPLIPAVTPPTPPTTKKVGWMPEWGFRHAPAELEQRLKAQREGTFGRRRFEELIAEAEQKAAELKSKPAKAALKRAIAAVQEAAETAPNDSLTDALEAAVLASNASRTIKQADALYAMAMAALDEDEEDVELLLLH